MKMLSNSTHTKHGEVFISLCAKADELVLVSPFCYSDFTEFAGAVANASTVRKIRFITTLKKDEVISKIDSLVSFSKEMVRVGMEWELLIDVHLHGKVYIFKKEGEPFAGIITSANLTHNGMARNHEWGVQIDDVDALKDLERNVMADVDYSLNEEQLVKIAVRVKAKYPLGAQCPKPDEVDIDDIVIAYPVAKGTRIFIKPVGSSDDKIYDGDHSGEPNMYFSKKRPAAVRIGDILIAYAVGGRRIMGAYKVTSEPLWTGDDDARWPWYVETDILTPKLLKYNWASVCPYVTQIANSYVDKYDKPVTNNGGKTLGALNFGCDKIRLNDEYGRYLLNQVMMLENEVQSKKGEAHG